MKRLAALLICFTLLVPSLAQDVPPVITPENAAALQMLQSAGSALPTGVQFSPDGRYILATTTDETLVFPADDPDAAPRIFPFTEFSFDRHGYLVIGNERWNLDTGLSFGVPPSIRVVRASDNDSAMIEVVKPGGGTMRVPTVITENIARTAVNDAFTVLAVATEGDYQHFIAPTVHLYRTVSGQQIAAIPHGRSGFPIQRLHFTHWGDSELLLVESMADTHMTQGEVVLIRLPQGTVETEYGGTIWDGVRYSRDGKFAYRLEDKIVYGTGSRIRSVPYADDGIFGSPEFFAVTSGGLAAVFNGDALQFAAFEEDGLGDFITVPLDPQVSRRWTTAGNHVVMNEGGTLHIWDILSGSTESLVIEPDPSIADDATFQLSPDLARYRYWADGLIYIRDTATHELVAELPETAIISPDWSRATYWDGKRLTVDDFAAEQDYLHEVNPRHRGKVADFDALSGNVIFQTDIFTVTNVDIAGDTVLSSFREAVKIVEAQFFSEGRCVVSFEHNGVLAFHETSGGIDCGEDGRLIANYSEAFTVTPNGGYIVGYTIDCYAPYSYVASYVYPLEGQSVEEFPLLLEFHYGCGRSAFAFTADETAIYYTDRLLRRTQLGGTGGAPVEAEAAEILLSYDDPVDYTYAMITSVFLSPDEKTIAVHVEDSNGSETVQERYIEVFALEDLQPGTLRRDVRPLQTIPDATVAYFSPDGRHVVTDTGLYSIEAVNQTPAVNGTISAFSPDSQVLATYQDGFVTLWRVSEPNANNFPLAQYDIRGVRELAFSADGTRLYVIRAGEVQTWGVAL